MTRKQGEKRRIDEFRKLRRNWRRIKKASIKTKAKSAAKKMKQMSPENGGMCMEGGEMEQLEGICAMRQIFRQPLAFFHFHRRLNG
jgi:uncharacterized protein YggL (DUF469 family)